MKSAELSIILPAYKESENLSLLLPGIEKTATALTANYEVVVVDTIEPLDNTKEICKRHEKVIYLNRTGKNSYGDAVRSGISRSSGKYIIFMDADFSHTPEFIEKIFLEKENADIVVASRYIEGGDTENNFILIAMSKIINFIYSYVLKLNCRDISNSFKLYNGDQLRGIELRCKNFDIVEEIFIKLVLEKKHIEQVIIKEIPFTFKKRKHGKTKRNLILFALTYFFTLIRLKRFSYKKSK